MSNKSKRGPQGNGRPDPAGSDVWGDYDPPRIVTTDAPADTERMPIFYVDDAAHTAPARVPAYVAVQAIKIGARQGPEAMTWHMVEKCLAPESIEVLETSEHITYEDAQRIFTQLGRLYYGQAQALAGK
jgi:hypothetical protein